MLRYYPDEYLGSEQAAIHLARLNSPEKWKPETMFPGEQAMWAGLGGSLNAETIEYQVYRMSLEIKRSDAMADVAALIARHCDFDIAVQKLRRSLHSGEITAEYCDQRGKFGFIQKDGWGGLDGGKILLRGIVELEDGWTRLILLRVDAIENLAKGASQHEACAATKPGDEKPGMPTLERRQLFAEWRASQGDYIPKLAEDTEQMKKVGVNRDDTRELRKDFPRRPRGKPKQPRNKKIGGR